MDNMTDPKANPNKNPIKKAKGGEAMKNLVKVPRTLFTRYPQITGDDPMQATVFWQWIDHNRGQSVFTDALRVYLAQFGYAPPGHKITAQQLENHRATFHHYWWMNSHQPQ